ncbi:MAG: hypothetical protein HY903_12750 [Deltaproteobacteria bacterium]|nr:hypothetical protein [Deltaproteobacteria bacterium]
MTLFSRRLPHVLTHADLAVLITPTYAEATGVDEDEALERLQEAVQRADIADELYDCVSTALAAAQGTRTEDQLMDKLSKGVQKRRGKLKALPPSTALSAFMVRINVALGHAPEALRGTLDTEKGRALLKSGLRELGEFLVDNLLR